MNNTKIYVETSFEGVYDMAKYKVDMNGYSFDDVAPLSHRQTMNLIDEYHLTQDKMIKEKLIISNFKLILSLVQKYQQRVSNLDDLFQVGVIGLIKAIDNFNTHLNVRFSTYAVPLIIGEMKRYMRENTSLRISRSIRDLAYKALNTNEEYMKMYQREATTGELADLLNVDEFSVVEALSSTQNMTSLSKEVQNDGNGPVDLESQIADVKNEMIDLTLRIDLQEAITHLSAVESKIIQKRYFDNMTQSEIAKDLMISQAQVSRIEKQALSQLRKFMKGHGI